jgi:alanine racemase
MVIKANGYGHGLLTTARVAVEGGAAALGVASLEEGITLRQAGVDVPVLILGSLYPFDNFPLLFTHHLTPTVASLEAAQALNDLAQKRRERLPVHLKIDSGFGRIGVSIPKALAFIQQVAGMTGLALEGIYTHFVSSDVDEPYTREQARAFLSVIEAAHHSGVRPRWIHLANSAALIRFPETHGTLARPGLAFYGVPPYAGAEKEAALQPALHWKTKIVYLKNISKGAAVSYARTWIAKRPSRIATLATGYADGYPRLLSNKGQVLLGGRRFPVIGRVTMDMMMVDVTDGSNVHVGDEAVLIGTQGSERITAQEVAAAAETNPYEILCRIAERVPRVTVHE